MLFSLKYKNMLIDIHKEVFAVKKDPLLLFTFRVHGHYTKDAYKEIVNSILNETGN